MTVSGLTSILGWKAVRKSLCGALLLTVCFPAPVIAQGFEGPAVGPGLGLGNFRTDDFQDFGSDLDRFPDVEWKPHLERDQDPASTSALGTDLPGSGAGTDRIARDMEAFLLDLDPDIREIVSNPLAPTLRLPASGLLADTIETSILESIARRPNISPQSAVETYFASNLSPALSVNADGLSLKPDTRVTYADIAKILGTTRRRPAEVPELHDFLNASAGRPPGFPVLQPIDKDGLPIDDQPSAQYVIGNDDIDLLIIGEDDIGWSGDVGNMTVVDIFGETEQCEVSVDGWVNLPACPTQSHLDRIQLLSRATVLVTHRSFIKDTAVPGQKRLTLLPAKHCQFQSRSHCSGFLDSDRKHIWTAAHCLVNRSIFTDPLVLPSIGESVDCPANWEMRAVLGLYRRTTAQDPIESDSIYACKSVTRTNEDTVKIRLDTDAEISRDLVPEGIPVFEGQLPAEFEGSIPALGSRLVAFGFPHTARPAIMRNGAVRPASFCSRTLFSNQTPDNPFPLTSRRPYNDYMCVSTDTLSGSSGGPVIAAMAGDEALAIGVISRANGVKLAEECKGAAEDSTMLNLASRIYPLIAE